MCHGCKSLLYLQRYCFYDEKVYISIITVVVHPQSYPQFVIDILDTALQCWTKKLLIITFTITRVFLCFGLKRILPSPLKEQNKSYQLQDIGRKYSIVLKKRFFKLIFQLDVIVIEVDNFTNHNLLSLE